MGEILLFNIKDPEKLTAIRLTALRLGIRCREVPPAQQSLTIAQLLNGIEAGKVSDQKSFDEELMLLNALPQADFQELLDVLRREGKTVRLKAVVTEHNRNWTAVQLYHALHAEDEAFKKRMQQQKTKQHRRK